MNKKKIFIIAILLIILIISTFLIFFNNKKAKNNKIGNNSSSQEIVDYILNINSYHATVEVEVNSNKKKNKYKIRQQYSNQGTNMQEIIEPSNIAGVKIIKEGDKLRIENSNLNLSTVFEKYNYIGDNALDLETFIKNYKDNSESKYEEENEQIIMKTVDNSNDKNIKNKKLYIEKKSGKPAKMEIKDTNKNSSIYIIYNEVNVNS